MIDALNPDNYIFDLASGGVDPLGYFFGPGPASSGEFVSGFSDVPLVVNVESTPIESPLPVPGPAIPSVSTSEGPMALIGDFTDVIGGPIDFPTTRPNTGLNDVLAGAFGLAQGLIESTGQVPATIPSAGTLSVNAVACPVTYTQGGKLVRQHLRKQQVKARKSPVTQCVTNRHMNSLNPHALRRATRRLSGFMSHVQSTQKAINKALGRHVSPSHRRRTSTRGGCYTCGRPARSCVC